MGLVFIKFLILCVLCVIINEVQCDLKKRDVRIILQEKRVPRSHKRGNRHNNDHHKHGSHKNHHKKEKPRYSSEEGSYEEMDASYSPEESYENLFHSFNPPKSSKNKGHKSHHHKPKKHHYNHPPPSVEYFGSNFESLEHSETRFKDDSSPISSTSFKNNWTPLESDRPVFASKEKTKPRKPRHKERKNQHHHQQNRFRSPVNNFIDLTTAYPQLVPFSSSFQPNNFSPNSGTFSNLNQKLIDSKQSPFVAEYPPNRLQKSAASFVKNNDSKLLNHNYEVREIVNEDVKFKDELAYRALTPLLQIANLQFADGKNIEKSVSNGTADGDVELKKTVRGRHLRGRNKFT